MVLLEAAAWAELGECDRAIRRLRGARRRLPEWATNGRIGFGVVQNLAATLVEAGRADEAANLMPEVERLAESLKEPLIHARVAWLQGLVHQGLGELTSAIRTYSRVQRVFLHSESAYDAALVSLDLTIALLEYGRPQEGIELAQDLEAIFRSRGIHREAMAAGLLVAEGLRQGTASVKLVRRVARYLRQARRDPTYRFSSSG